MEDIAAALAAEIHNYGILKEWFFTDRDSEEELLLRGTLTSRLDRAPLLDAILQLCQPRIALLG